MKIIINDDRQISTIQEEFKRFFPNLNIVFFARPSKAESSSSSKPVRHTKTLLACRSTHHEGIIEITPTMSVRDLKDHFRDVYGLSVDILRTSSGAGELRPGENNSLEEANKAS